ncbi:hypothetical protein DFH06DRAFT_1143429 [Mycena polygramma]|nr:hypothetical protein DFH06DRAFT_1143429 [Mycena polygramma]
MFSCKGWMVDTCRCNGIQDSQSKTEGKLFGEHETVKMRARQAERTRKEKKERRSDLGIGEGNRIFVPSAQQNEETKSGMDDGTKDEGKLERKAEERRGGGDRTLIKSGGSRKSDTRNERNENRAKSKPTRDAKEEGSEHCADTDERWAKIPFGQPIDKSLSRARRHPGNLYRIRGLWGRTSAPAEDVWVTKVQEQEHSARMQAG